MNPSARISLLNASSAATWEPRQLALSASQATALRPLRSTVTRRAPTGAPSRQRSATPRRQPPRRRATAAATARTRSSGLSCLGVHQGPRFERPHLGQTPHVPLGVGEPRAEKRRDQRFGESRADHPRAEHEDVGVIVKHALRRRVRVVTESGADAWQLVGGDAGADAAAADDQPAIGPAVEYRASDRLGVVGIVDGLGGMRAEVDRVVTAASIAMRPDGPSG